MRNFKRIISFALVLVLTLSNTMWAKPLGEVVKEKKIRISSDNLDIVALSLSGKKIDNFTIKTKELPELRVFDNFPIKDVQLMKLKVENELKEILFVQLNSDNKDIIEKLKKTIQEYKKVLENKNYVDNFIKNEDDSKVIRVENKDGGTPLVPLTPAEEIKPDIPLTPLTPAEEIEPDKKDEGTPLVPLTPAEEVEPDKKDEGTPLVPLTPAEEVEPDKKDEGTPLVPLTPAEEVEPDKKDEGTPLVPLTPAKEIEPDIPLTPLTPAEEVEPDKKEEGTPLVPLTPAEEVEPDKKDEGTPLVPLTPAEEIEPDKKDEGTPLVPLTPAEEIEPDIPLTPLEPAEEVEPDNHTPRTRDFNSGKMMNEAEFRAKFLELINAERAKLGRAPLTYNEALKKGTDLRSSEMAEFGYLRSGENLDKKHTRPDGESSFRTAFDYLENYETTKGGNLGENILLQGFASREYNKDAKHHDENLEGEYTVEEFLSNPTLVAKSLFEQWKHSQGHYDNMMHENYKSFWVSAKLGDGYKEKDGTKDKDYTVLIGTTVFDVFDQSEYEKFNKNKEEQLVEEQPVEEKPVEEKPVEEQPIEQPVEQPVEQPEEQPVEENTEEEQPVEANTEEQPEETQKAA